MAFPLGELEVNPVDSRINYNVVEGDNLLTCPYNSSHAVLELKFPKHVNKCHRAHLEEQRKKGEQSKFGICQYNASHHIAKQLLAWHEKECKEKVNNCGWDVEDLGMVGWSGSDPGTNSTEGSGADDNKDVAADPDGWTTVGKKDKAGGKKPVVLKAILQPEVRIAKEDQEMIHAGEDWDKEPNPYNKQLNPDKKIHTLRKTGYAYIKTDPLVGLTKSQKKEFYAQEQAAMRSYEKQALYERLQQQRKASSGQGSSSGAASGHPSMYGEDTGIYSIRE